MKRFAFGLALVFSMMLSSSAYAVTCGGPACTGQWPHTTGCDVGAYNSVSPVSGSGYRAELRYSNTCVTRWARTTLIYAPPSAVNIYARNQFGDGSGVFINSANSNIYGYQLWTQQRYGLQIYACGGPNSGSYFCTSLG